jgi:hypothetical protein
MDDIIDHVFPNLESLPIEIHTLDVYNKFQYRKCKLMVIMGSLCEFSNFRDLDVKSKTHIITNIEKSCYDAIIKKARTDEIPRTWENRKFKYMYSDKISRVARSYLLKKCIDNLTVSRDIGVYSDETLYPNAQKKQKQLLKQMHEVDLESKAKVITNYVLSDV